MSFKAYLFSKRLWINILLAIGVTVLLLLFAMFVLRIYTNHGESFAVPSMKGMSIEQVEEQIRENDLQYKIIDSLFTKQAVPGSVVEQIPEAGFLVKRGRTIFLTICASKPEQVVMPKLIDISYRQAMNLMLSFGLNLGNVDYVPSEYPNLVLEQKKDGKPIKEGILVNKGSNIDLTVGQNRFGAKTAIPNLIGIRIDQAHELLGASYLNPGAIIYDSTIKTMEDSTQARVWRQQPEPIPGTRIEQGTSIDFWLTIDTDKIKKANI